MSSCHFAVLLLVASIAVAMLTEADAWITPTPIMLPRSSLLIPTTLDINPIPSVKDLVDALDQTGDVLDQTPLLRMATELSPVGDAIDVIDTANEVADALSEQGVPDHHIIIGFSVVAVVGVAAYLFWQQQSTDEGEGEAEAVKIVENEAATISNSTDLFEEEISRLKESLLAEETLRKETEAKLAVAVEANKQLEMQGVLREAEYQQEIDSIRKLSYKILKLIKKRVGKRYESIRRKKD